MSWSFNAIGKPKAVLEKARKEIGAYALAEPEETVRGKVLHQIEAIMLAMPESSAVRVAASGSQQSNYVASGAPVEGVFNTLRVEIEPVWGFAE